MEQGKNQGDFTLQESDYSGCAMLHKQNEDGGLWEGGYR